VTTTYREKKIKQSMVDLYDENPKNHSKTTRMCRRGVAKFLLTRELADVVGAAEFVLDQVGKLPRLRHDGSTEPGDTIANVSTHVPEIR
jgi:hypothetical protein